MKMGLLGSSVDVSRYATAHKEPVALKERRWKLDTITTSTSLREPAVQKHLGAFLLDFIIISTILEHSKVAGDRRAYYIRSLRILTFTSLRMADNNNANGNSARLTTTGNMVAESRRRVHDIVAQVDAEMDRRARHAARARHWGWLPTMIQEWIIGERVPPYRFPGDTTPGHRLPPLGVPLEQAFAAHVACTRREIWRSGELSDEVRVLREKNDRLER
ncbi:hypothetical protein E3N88_21807 [Mikania micrantha]|uniref:Uncharacterized protein n=1 Tax=Mikania micrantha TaxID=192012 RepID=A0A5N6N8K6_9ASTR|nr:hypothetical protein E3N88_21807 [Mikania micrantha]